MTLRFKLWFVDIYLWWLVTHATARRMDERWLLQPDDTILATQNENLHLTWSYKTPPAEVTQTPGGSKISLSHHVPGNTFENMLFEGIIDPATGTIQSKFVMRFSDTSLWGSGNQINLQFGNLTYAVSGNYLLDINFEGRQETLSDVVEIKVFQRPHWVIKPTAKTYVNQASDLTLTWGMRLSQHTPSVQTLTFLHGPRRGTPPLVTCSQDKQNRAWTMSYSSNHRVSMTTVERLEWVEVVVSVSNATVEDRGQYVLDVVYEGEVAALYSDIEISVSKDVPWESAPPDVVYTVESQDLELIYIPEVSRGSSATHNYELRMRKPTDMELAYLSAPLDATSTASSNVRFDKRLDIRYQRRYRKLTVGIQNVQMSDNGEYLLLMSLNNDLVASHTFQLKVLNEYQLIPSISMEGTMVTIENASSAPPGRYTVSVSPEIPPPTITFCTRAAAGEGQVCTTAQKVHNMDTEVTEESLRRGAVEIQVDYMFYVYSLTLGTKAAETGAVSAAANVFACVTSDVNNCLVLVIVFSSLLFVFLIVILILAICYCKRRKREPHEEKGEHEVKVAPKSNNAPTASVPTKSGMRYGRVSTSDDIFTHTFPRSSNYANVNNIPRHFRHQHANSPVESQSTINRDSFPSISHTGPRTTPQPSSRNYRFSDSDGLSNASSKGSRGNTKITVFMTENRRERKVSQEGFNTSFCGDNIADGSFSTLPSRRSTSDPPRHVTGVAGRDRLPTAGSNKSATSGVSPSPGSKFEVTAVKTSVVPSG